MKIYNPKIEKVSLDKVRLNCQFESNGVKDTLWYEFDAKWEEYLVIEQSDAFVVGLILLALKNNEDIYIEGKISRRLFYGLTNYVIPALVDAKLFDTKINLHSKQLSSLHFQLSNKNATGISCGIDSLSTYLNNKSLGESLNIDMLTFFNVGSNGDFGGTNARKLFNYRVQEVNKFCEYVDKELLTVDSNLSELLKLNFAATATVRNISVVLCLQKLFSNYYYASGVKYDSFLLSSDFMGYYDLLVLHGLSTESTHVYSSMTHLTREERTELVGINYHVTSNYLDVCVSLQPEKSVKNCSKCYKCMMTQLTLEVNGMLDKFDRVFDLKVYETNKPKFLGLILLNKSQSKVYSSLYKYSISKGFKFSLIHIYFKYYLLYKQSKKKIKKLIKKALKVEN